MYVSLPPPPPTPAYALHGFARYVNHSKTVRLRDTGWYCENVSAQQANTISAGGGERQVAHTRAQSFPESGESRACRLFSIVGGTRFCWNWRSTCVGWQHGRARSQSCLTRKTGRTTTRTVARSGQTKPEFAFADDNFAENICRAVRERRNCPSGKIDRRRSSVPARRFRCHTSFFFFFFHVFAHPTERGGPSSVVLRFLRSLRFGPPTNSVFIHHVQVASEFFFFWLRFEFSFFLHARIRLYKTYTMSTRAKPRSGPTELWPRSANGSRY